MRFYQNISLKLKISSYNTAYFCKGGIVIKYISLNEYMKINNVGYNVALQILNSGKVDYIKTTNGRYKIAIYNNDTISIKEYEKVVRENEKLKTIIGNMYNILKEVKNV